MLGKMGNIKVPKALKNCGEKLNVQSIKSKVSKIYKRGKNNQKKARIHCLIIYKDKIGARVIAKQVVFAL